MDADPLDLSSEELRAFTLKRDGPGLLRLASHVVVAVITGTAVMTARGTILVAPALILHGIVVTFLFCPLHESVHRTAFRTPWLNWLAGVIGGTVIVLPPRFFRYFHFAHHRHTQIPGDDPELLTPKPTSWAGYICVLSGLEYWRRTVGGLMRRSLGQIELAYVPVSRRASVVAEARWFVAFYAVLAGLSIGFGKDWALWLWFYPALLGQPFLRAYLLAEHWGCPSVADKWVNTRSTVSNPFVRWLAWNMPYHAEHHAHASVPFHALPALSERYTEKRKAVSLGYAVFHGSEVPNLIRHGNGI
ncbi:MAG: fatty acid desaturase [Rhodospirillaceae bacterium]|nr:fatty acid desaturase [Rhodospirillaceae bacterium]